MKGLRHLVILAAAMAFPAPSGAMAQTYCEGLRDARKVMEPFMADGAPALVTLDNLMRTRCGAAGSTGPSGGQPPVAATSPLPVRGSNPFVGKWATDFRTVSFAEAVGGQMRGTFDLNGGRIIGEVRGDIFEGYWIQDRSERTCNAVLDNSRNWGHVTLRVFGDRLAGRWGYCDEAYHANWDGKRLTQ